jgi:predicted metal-dependent hydrolase
VWFGGRALPLHVGTTPRSVARRGTDALTVSGPEKDRAQAIYRWYRREARHRFRGLVDEEAQRLRLAPQSVTVRDQKTRWASCSAAGNLSFSWRLVIAPPEVQRYVVVHELCHLRIANHSKAFWSQLDDALPEWRDAAGWLREHGNELREYEAQAATD